MNQLKTMCLTWDNSNEGFKNIIKQYLENRNSEITLAGEFEVAPSTIKRWANGVTAPLTRMQKLIINYIAKLS